MSGSNSFISFRINKVSIHLTEMNWTVSLVCPPGGGEVTCGGRTCGRAAAEGGGRGDGRCDRWCEVAAGVARRGGHVAPGQAARQRQRQLGLRLLLHGLVLSPRRLRHEPGGPQRERRRSEPERLNFIPAIY